MNLTDLTTPLMMEPGVTVSMCEQAARDVAISMWMVPPAIAALVVCTMIIINARKIGSMRIYWLCVIVQVLIVAMVLIGRWV